MASKLFPIPQDTPYTDGNPSKFNMLWLRFFKAMSDNLLAGSTIKYIGSDYTTSTTDFTSPRYAPIAPVVVKDFSYIINNCIVFCTYSSATALATALTIPLPVKPALAFDVNGTIYPADTAQIILPISTQYVRFWYVTSKES